MRSYLTSRFQCCTISNSFIKWEKVLAGVPQGSILGPLLFNIFITDIFLFLQNCELASYADGSIKNISNIIISLSHEFTVLYKWLYNNFMVLNSDKCSIILLGVDDELQTDLVCENEILKNK